MRTRLALIAWAVGLGVVVLAVPVRGQDTTTLLSNFLVGLRNGTIGSTTLNLTYQAANGTIAAPSFAAASSTGSGVWFDTSSSYTVVQFGGTAGIAVSNAPSVDMRSDTLIRWSSTAAHTGTKDLVLSRGGVNLFRAGNATQGIEFNFDNVTVSTCGTGTVSTGSRGSGGEITATGATACTVNFTTPWTNTPFCAIEEETTAVAQRISAISASAFTVTGLTSGDKFMYQCTGRY